MADETRAPAEPYENFAGTVGRTFAGSQSWWPPRPEAGPDAPNIVVVLVDDLGFADLGCYGSEIPTPNVDGIASDGLKFTNFHVTPMCSPTRASLLTGINPHRVGAGHVSNSDPGFPGYAAELSEDVATMAEMFRDGGWHTMAIGKWHLTKDVDLSDAGSRHSWPLQRGFDRYYGVLDAFTNLHHPHRLVEDNHTVEIDRYPEGYHLTDDLTDRAISMIRQTKASDPTKPFLCYFAHLAVHAPLQARDEDVLAHRGRYEAGWDALREQRHRRQIELGVLPPDTKLPPPNAEPGDEVGPWDELDPADKRLFARYMEVYAGMVTGVDRSVGRLREALAELGELDNTIMLFLSDNGASREGESAGTTSYLRSLVSKNATDIEDLDFDRARIDLAGGPRALVHYPRGWAQASNTPFRLYKINAHAGGHSVPLVIDWPRGRRSGLMGAGQRDQWVHVTDLLPTLLDLTGLDPSPERNGRVRQPLDGTSLAAVLLDDAVVHDRGPQYLELQGHRGLFLRDWEIVTRHEPLTPFGDHEWELYNLRTDRTETDDVAARHPEVVAELAAIWEREARRNQVYPLDEGSRLRYIDRPPYEAPLQEPVRVIAGTPTLERFRSLQLIQWRNFTIDIELSYEEGDHGVLVSHGDQGGGYMLHVSTDGELVYTHNGYGKMTDLRCGPLSPGTSRIRIEVTAPGGWLWHVEVFVQDRSTGRVEDLLALGAMAPFQGIDVGIDRRSPVSWELYEQHGNFAWSGELKAVTYTPGDLAPDAGPNFIELLREIGLRYE